VETAVEKLKTTIKDTFVMLNGMPSYIGLEQKERLEREAFRNVVHELLSIGSKEKLNRVNVRLKKGIEGFTDMESVLDERGFEHFTTSVEYRKDLSEVKNFESKFTFVTLQDKGFTEIEFKNIWKMTMMDSGNRSSTLPIEEHLNAVMYELGSGWKSNCGLFYLDGIPVAICIPHIEPGTVDEGRLFYFGVLPEMRGKGYATELHHYSLNVMKEMGASYYIGSTHETNKPMQRVFEKSGCEEIGRRSSYYFYF
jgi:ribosomal protein S18 acetylase RimI-like enzyme